MCNYRSINEVINTVTFLYFCIFSSPLCAQTYLYQSQSQTLGSHLFSIMEFNSAQPFMMPPLDSAVRLSANITPQLNPNPGTHQILSLIMNEDNMGNNNFSGYPWPLYIQLTSNNNFGDGAGATVREISTGSNWETGYHAETYAFGGGTKIGYNVEMHKFPSATYTRTVGMNFLAMNNGTVTGAPATSLWDDQALNIQSQPGVWWDSGLLFDGSLVKTGVNFSPSSSGTRAIWVQGNYTVALDAGNSPIRMNAGTPIQLEPTGQITISFDAPNSRIVFRNGSKILAYISTNQVATGPLN